MILDGQAIDLSPRHMSRVPIEILPNHNRHLSPVKMEVIPPGCNREALWPLRMRFALVLPEAMALSTAAFCAV